MDQELVARLRDVSVKDLNALTQYANQWLSAVESLCCRIQAAERLLGERPSYVVSGLSEERRKGIGESLLKENKSEAFLLYILDEWRTLFHLANNVTNWKGNLSDEARRKLGDALRVVELAIANELHMELKPIRFRDQTAMTAHDAVQLIGTLIDLDAGPIFDWDSRTSSDGGPYKEWARVKECRELLKKTADVTPDLLRELETRIATENLKTQRFRLDQATQTVGPAVPVPAMPKPDQGEGNGGTGSSPPPCPRSEPALRQDDYQQILDILRSMSVYIERNPSAFAALDEEGIRNHFLLQLNGQFKGGATGETVNGSGKTDILIRVGDRNVFIAECKFWHGQEKFGEAIDQLLSYLTWRDCKCALLIFNRNKDTGAVAQKIHEAMQARKEYKQTLTHDLQGDSQYIFAKADDSGREILITTQLFDVPRN